MTEMNTEIFSCADPVNIKKVTLRRDGSINSICNHVIIYRVGYIIKLKVAVFGRVIKGLEVIDKITAQPKGAGDRPAEDIRMFVTVEEMSRKKIEKEYGYIFPDPKK